LTHSSVCTIHDNSVRIKESAKSKSEVSSKRTSYSWSSTMEHVDTMLNTWIEDQNQCHMPVSMLLVQAKACSVYEDLSEGDDNVKLFSRFIERYNVYNIKITGEAAADSVVALHHIE
jgi:hypothetical protein